MAHHLPSRKRPRTHAPPEEDMITPAVEVPVLDPPTSLVTPDLIYELVSNGSLAPHFPHVYDVCHQPGWHGRRNVHPEVEFGSVLVHVNAVNEGTTVSTSDTNLKHVPLLLRAFRKKTEASGALCHNASRMGALHALSPGPQAIDVWAPMAVMHVVRALAVTGTGLQFQGPVVCHQNIHSRPVLVDGRQHLVARRAQTPVSGSAPLQTMINWKVKYTLPVTYPGNQSDSVQIAWESDEPVETPYSLDLVDDARSRGLLIQNFVPLGPPQPGYILMDPLSPFQLKIHWTGGTPPS